MLSISQLCVDYGSTRIIRHFDLQLGSDEILMLVGPTGCGKTTILQAVAGLIPIAAGSIEMNGWQATPRSDVLPEKRNVGMVFQDFALFPHLSVQENVAFRLSDPAPAEHWLELLGLTEFRQAKPGRLSGGQKQRVALARALAHGPSLILLDEPLSNLDAALKETLRWEIRDALKQAKVPAIWVTHDQSEALSVGDRLGVLREGTLEQIDSPQQCYNRPANQFVAGFLGEASFLPGSLEGNTASTVLGNVTADAVDGAGGEVSILLRPDDCSMTPAPQAGNGSLMRAQFEGSSWLYTVALDSGDAIKLRCHREQRFETGERVQLEITRGQPVAAFPREA